MNVPFVVALVSLVLQLGTTVAMTILGRAARWRKAWWIAAIAGTAAAYNATDLVATLRTEITSTISWTLRANYFNATMHAVAWLGYTYSGPDSSWGSLPTWARRTMLGAALAAAFLGVTGVFIFDGTVERLIVPALGIDTPRAKLSDLGAVLGALPVALLAFSAVAWSRRARAGEAGSWPIVIGFIVFVLVAVEELAVASGWLRFMFLGDLGYVCVVTPVTLQLLARFRDDAEALDTLSARLASDVQRRTDERDEARRAMVEQQRLAALGRLAAGVGHEINNPLQYLRFNLEELREVIERDGDAEARAVVAQALEGTDRIRQVVDDLRTYARPGDRDEAVLDVRDVVRAALRVGAHQWRHGITLDVQLGDVPLVEGNEGRLVQVVLNPLVNGAQAMIAAADPARHTLHVATRTTPAGWAEIEVRDEGPGFSRDVMGRLGEPYLTTRAQQGGSGLGLFVSRGIVEAHGGTVSFGNDPNGGAVVRIRLPAARLSRRTPEATAIPTAPAEPPVLSDPAQRPRVLLVEDDEAALRALLRGLTAEGMDAHGEASARRALAWLETATVDLVVTDLMMPEMSGVEFAEALGRTHPTLRERLVVLTGGASTADAEAFLADERLLVLEKPITRQALSQQLRARLGR
ncbi:MAG: response regulator [Gemmatimonadetes bacterium]|nr:response regulator [Gemmatimonadota bacterium]